MTLVSFDEEKCSLTLQTIHKEEILYARTDSEARELYRQLSLRSLGSDFGHDYGIVNYVGSSPFGKSYICESRDQYRKMLIV